MDCEAIKIELTNILTKVAHMERIKEYEILLNLQPSTTEGFLSVLYTGVVRNKIDGYNVSLIIKLVPNYGGAHYHLLYTNEANFYSKIFPVLDDFQRKKKDAHFFDEIPRYFCSGLETGKEYIALNNLKPLGYKQHDKRKFLEKEHLELIFKVLGKFHALSFSFKDQYPEKYNEMLKDVVDVFDNFNEDHSAVKEVERNVGNAFNTLDPVNDRNIWEKLSRIENVKHEFLNLCNYRGNFKCVIHGDFWPNNIVFKHSSEAHLEDMKILDFQMVKEGTPVHDLSFIFYSGASSEDLGKLEEYLNIYYNSFSSFTEELGSEPEKIYPFSDLLKEWKEYGLFGVYMGINLQALRLLTDEDILNLQNDSKDKQEEADEMWKEKWNEIGKSEEFKLGVKNIILHAIQHNLFE